MIDNISKEENAIVAFIDILGFSELISKSKNDATQIYSDLSSNIKVAKNYSVLQFQSIFNDIINNQRELNPTLPFINLIEKFHYKQFSDNIMIYYKYDEKIKEDLYAGFLFVTLSSLFYQIILLFNNYYVRGGISYGYHYSNDDIIFSEGLLNSYKIEKETIYPRISIDRKKKKIGNLGKLGINSKPFEPIFVCDWAGDVFINNFLFLRKLNSSIQNSVKNIVNNDPIIEKFLSSYKNNDSYDADSFRISIEAKIKKNLKKYRNKDHNTYLKYVWLTNFLKWNLNKKCNLKFNSFSISK